MCQKTGQKMGTRMYKATSCLAWVVDRLSNVLHVAFAPLAHKNTPISWWHFLLRLSWRQSYTYASSFIFLFFYQDLITRRR